MATLTELLATGLTDRVVNDLFGSTTAASTGNTTQSTQMGVVKIAAAGGAITLTNSRITASSVILCSLLSSDATATAARVTDIGAGTATFRTDANPTAETSIAYWIVPTVAQVMALGIPAEAAKALFEFSSTAVAGNATLNTPVGKCIMAAAASSLTLTNNKIRSTSTIFATVQSNDASFRQVGVTASAGSAVFSVNSAATGDTSIVYWVIN